MPAQPDRNIIIAAGGTASGAFGTGQGQRGSFQLPSVMVGTSITVKVSNDGATWTDCPVEGNEANPITSTAADRTYSLPVKAFSFKYLQLVSNAVETGGATITVFMRD